MKRKLIVWTVALAAGATFASVPVTVNYVGHLTGVTSEGTEKALSEKVMMMVFRLYDKPGYGRTGDKANPLWGRRASVALTEGDFDLDLADTLGVAVDDAQYVSLGDAIASVVKAGSSDIYIGLTPENDSNAEIFPRQKLTAVPTAVQAAAVRTVSGDFTATGGVFTVRGRLVVNSIATLTEGVSYGSVSLGPKAAVDMRAGVVVKGPLEAGRFEAANLTADRAEVGTLQTQDGGRLAVSNRLTCVGTLTWKGDADWADRPVATPSVAAAVSAGHVSAARIVTDRFDNPQGFSKTRWHVLGDWKAEASLPSQDREEQSFLVCNTATGAKEYRTSVVGGLWEAPCDCLAYFQTSLLNLSASDSVWLQFYVVPDANRSDYSSRNPVGVAALGPGEGGTLQTAVPVLLRKGELVKWLGYNANATVAGSVEVTHTRVTAIRYLTFNW